LKNSSNQGKNYESSRPKK